jgi:hypothetical protein
MIHQLAHRIQALFGGGQRQRDIFLDLCQRYESRLNQFPFPVRPAASAEKIGVLITPWLWTASPLFCIEIALMLVQKGRRVTLLMDDGNVVANAPEPAHGRALRKLLGYLQSCAEVCEVAVESAGEADEETARALFNFNAVWQMRGEQAAGKFVEANPEAVEKMAIHLGRVEGILKREKFAWILSPGGIFGLSGLYVAAARKTGTAFTTYDSGVGVLRLAQDAVASHLGDIPRAFHALHSRWKASPEERRRVFALASGEIEDRAAARDFRQFQVAAAAKRDDLRYDILVPLNIRWDSAALDRQRFFPTVQEWLEALLKWVAAHPGVKICLRQHPRERLDFARGSDDLPAVLSGFASLGERVRFVPAAEEINTYDLLRHAKVVLPHTSTIGIEAAFLRKPVVLATTCYYGDLGFVWPTTSVGEYFTRIEQALTGELTVSDDQYDDAALAYFLTQRCAFIRTEFTPHRENFLQWSQMPPETLWAGPENEDLCTSLLTRELLSSVRYRRLVQE